MGQMVVKEEVADVVFNFGIWNPDYPSIITRNEFILDFDCFSKLPIESQDTKPSELAKDFNKRIETLFEASITDKLREEMSR